MAVIANKVIEAMKEAFDVFDKMELPIEERKCTLEYDAVIALINGFEQLERERDAAVEQLRVGGRSCTSCRFAEDNLENAKVCEECQVTLSDLTYLNWQWRGV